MSRLTNLPEDIVLHILFFLTPLDIVRLRQGSKTLYPVTQQPSVWIHAYKTTALPRPPGPYARAGDQHALEFLERTLVTSATLEPWTARSFRLPASRTVLRTGEHLHRWHFSWNSWFITTIGSSLVYRNFDSEDPDMHVLFRLDDACKRFHIFACADTVTITGHPVTYALVKGDIPGSPLALLRIVGHFRSSSLSLESTLSLSFPGHDEITTMIASPRYVCMTTTELYGDFALALLDVTTEKVYRLQAFVSALAPEELKRFTDGGFDSRFVQFLFTDTHILLIFDDYLGIHETSNSDLLIQAFSLPSEDDSDAAPYEDGKLRMTHEGVCQKFELPQWVLRANKVTQISGMKTTEIRLMNSVWTGKETVVNALDITLSPGPSPGLGTIRLTQFTPLFSMEGIHFYADVASSEDGFGRGVYCVSGNWQTRIQTFSVDAGGQRCRVDLGPIADVSRLDSGRFGCVRMQFGAWNGKACYVCHIKDDEVSIFEFL